MKCLRTTSRYLHLGNGNIGLLILVLGLDGAGLDVKITSWYYSTDSVVFN